jgi:hypothetical protein
MEPFYGLFPLNCPFSAGLECVFRREHRYRLVPDQGDPGCAFYGSLSALWLRLVGGRMGTLGYLLA